MTNTVPYYEDFSEIKKKEADIFFFKPLGSLRAPPRSNFFSSRSIKLKLRQLVLIHLTQRFRVILGDVETYLRGFENSL